MQIRNVGPSKPAVDESQMQKLPAEFQENNRMNWAGLECERSPAV